MASCLALFACSSEDSTGGSASSDDAGAHETGGGDATTGGDAGTTDAGSRGLFYEDRTLNIAHRGGRNLAPESTLVAFQNALDVGADALELDVHATSDGVLVVMHDDTVDRTTDGTGAVKEMTFDEIRQLDAGYTFTTDGGQTFPHRGMGIQVPTVGEVIDAHPDAHFVIEIKQSSPSVVPAFVQLLADKGLRTDQAIVGSFHGAVLDELRAAAPHLWTSFGLGEVVDFVFLAPDDEATYEPPGEFLQVPTMQAGIEVVNQQFMDRAERFDLGTHIWTINDPKEMADLVGLGVSGIITDDPAALAGVLGM